MTITAKRYVKDGIETTLEYGVGGGRYYVKLDDVVLAECFSYRAPWIKGQEAEKALKETGWKA